MKKRKLVMIVFNNNTPSIPSPEAEAEAAMHFSLDVQNTGSGQTGTF